MWTPKRIVLLAVGFILFCTAYMVYGRFLGGIDGLPPLPEDYCQPATGSDDSFEPPKQRRPILESKLTQAFGQECPELQRPIKLELHARSMVLAAGQFQIEADGRRVCLSPLSVALFGKDKGDGRPLE